MLTAFVEAAMRQATYEILPDDEGFFGSIPHLQGVWAQASALEQCRTELREALEGWLLLGLRSDHIIPAIDGLDLVR